MKNASFQAILFTLVASTALMGCPGDDDQQPPQQGPVGPKGDRGPRGLQGEPADVLDRVEIVSTDDEAINGYDDVVIARCPDSHPRVLYGGCEVSMEFSLSLNRRIPEDEDRNEGFGCRVGNVWSSDPDNPEYGPVALTAYATCVSD